MSEQDQYFHFTLGPVQGFVAQARRTRDFWAGSFLLSWLSAVAMQAVIKQQGEIIFPEVSDHYLNWLEGIGQSGTEPQQGGVPNRFKGGLAKVPKDFKPELVTESIQHAWAELAEAIWQQDLSHCPSETRAIWDRQVKNFWEISWALSDNATESNLLDRRKNWRHYLPPEEAGVKCMMMDGWQELSGIATPNAKGLDPFWNTVIEQGGSGIKTDLRPHEYLCAIAFIKRRFVHCFKDLNATMPGGWTLQGWEVKSSVPSVAYIAAAPWLAQVLMHAPEDKLKLFHDEAKKLTQSYGEYQTRLDCVDRALNQRDDGKLFWNTKSLDGNVFFEAALENKNIYEDQAQAKRVLQALKHLRGSVDDIDLVSPFYAVLMMDGDSLGSHMSDTTKQEKISKGLETFTSGVQEKVEKHSGFLIYAGGDDVLALLPLEHALTCANELRTHYLNSFSDYPDINTTLSGAIEYAHIKMPLGKVLADAHHLLDDIAKNATGRDSIAVRVWKPGGQHLQWAMPWKYALVDGSDTDGTERIVVIDKMVKGFQDYKQYMPFSNSFFFHVEERFVSLLSKNEQGESVLDNDFSLETMTSLIASEYINSGVNSNIKISASQAKAIVKPLLEQCFSVKRILEENGQERFEQTQQLNVKALQFIRFLVQKGVDNG